MTTVKNIMNYYTGQFHIIKYTIKSSDRIYNIKDNNIIQYNGQYSKVGHTKLYLHIHTHTYIYIYIHTVKCIMV